MARSSVSSLFCLLLVAALAGGAYTLCRTLRHDPRFAVRHIDVECGAAKTPNEIRKLCGIREGDNLFSFSARDVRERIETASLNIESVNVRKILPDTLHIEVRDRVPVALLYGDNKLAVDREGLVFSLLKDDAKRYRSLPIVDDSASEAIHSRRLRAGQRLIREKGWPKTVEGRMRRTLEFLDAVSYDLASENPILNADVASEVWLVLTDRKHRLIYIPWEDIPNDDTMRLASRMYASAFKDPRAASFGTFHVMLTSDRGPIVLVTR